MRKTKSMGNLRGQLGEPKPASPEDDKRRASIEGLKKGKSFAGKPATAGKHSLEAFKAQVREKAAMNKSKPAIGARLLQCVRKAQSAKAQTEEGMKKAKSLCDMKVPQNEALSPRGAVKRVVSATGLKKVSSYGD